MEYHVEKLTAPDIARLSPELREQVEQLRADIAELRTEGLADDPDFAGELAGSDTDLYELALEELKGDGVQLIRRTGRYQPPSRSATPPVEPAPAKPGRPAREKRAKKEHPAYTGPALDRDGQPVSVGDTVEAEVGGKSVQATIINLKRHEGGGHQIKYRGDDGKWKTPMVAPEKVRKMATGTVPKSAIENDTPVVEFKEALPAGLVKAAIVADRTDCDENKVILVEPTEKVVIDAPMVADPANGDKILVHPDGTAMTVVKGGEVDKHFEPTGNANIEHKKDGTVAFDPEVAKIIRDASNPDAIAFNAMLGAAEENAKMENREKARTRKAPANAVPAGDSKPENGEDEEEKTRDKTSYSAVKRARPTAKCEFSREKAKSPALVTFLEGMRLRWHDGESKDKIVGVYWLDETKEVALKVKVYDWLDVFSDVRFFTVCPARAKLKRIDKPRRGTYKVLFSEEAMKDFYRYPNDSSCRRVARALFVECYRNGGCSDERQKRLYTLFATKCSRQEKAHSREYMKYTHGKASERWKSYEGDKTYPEIYREVLAELRKKK